MMNTTFAYGYEGSEMGVRKQSVVALVDGFRGGVVDGSMTDMVTRGERLQHDSGMLIVRRMKRSDVVVEVHFG